MIPKKLHYCWFGPNEMSPLNKKCIETWRVLLPDYEIKCWDESNSPLDDCPYIREAYIKKKWAHVADYVRLYALYQEGGVYLDTDMYLVRSLDALLLSEFFIGAIYHNHHLGMGAFGASAQSPHIAHLLSIYRLFPKFVDKVNTDYMEAYILSLAGTNTLQVDEVTNIAGIVIYPPVYFYPYTKREAYHKEEFRSKIREETFAVHLWESSWQPEEFVDFWWNNFDDGLYKVKRKLLRNPFQSLQYYKEFAWHIRRMWSEKRKHKHATDKLEKA